ncbi:uncharacterized protein LOC133822042 [Humulus lupulus]|uniref:uncharacterized protein LOC133822042 n=1 Tax=Humulus lupulus TaxID=3486 RepID=UPI002B409290|nr:uncharacterized protein LOC133822042 [Humulus lupulus]
MLTQLGNWSSSTPLLVPCVLPGRAIAIAIASSTTSGSCQIIRVREVTSLSSSSSISTKLYAAARRRVRFNEEDEDDDEEEEYGYHEEIGMLELYSQNARGEALLVQTVLHAQEIQILIFKGFSSCLSYSTSPDPSKSIVPARAVIKSIDRIKGPFDPSNIEYIQKGLSWEEFKTTLLSEYENK